MSFALRHTSICSIARHKFILTLLTFPSGSGRWGRGGGPQGSGLLIQVVSEYRWPLTQVSLYYVLLKTIQIRG